MVSTSFSTQVQIHIMILSHYRLSKIEIVSGKKIMHRDSNLVRKKQQILELGKLGNIAYLIIDHRQMTKLLSKYIQNLLTNQRIILDIGTFYFLLI